MQDSLVLEQPHEAVGETGAELARVELLGQTEEGTRVPVKVDCVENGGRFLKLVLLEIVIQTTAWSSEMCAS